MGFNIDDRTSRYVFGWQARTLGENGGVTPAFAAASNGRAKLVRLLAAHAGELDAPPSSGPDAGQSPLWHAAYFNAVAVAEALATSGADINFRFRHAGRVGSVVADARSAAAAADGGGGGGGPGPEYAGATPLTAAMKRCHVEVATALRRHGAAGGLSRTDTSRYAAHCRASGAPGAAGEARAAARGLEVKRFLVFECAKAGDVATVRRILRRGEVAVDWANSADGGQTLAMVAAGAGHYALLAMLAAEFGAALGATDARGRTALALARAGGHEACAQLLEEHAGAAAAAQDEQHGHDEEEEEAAGGAAADRMEKMRREFSAMEK